MFRRVDNTQQPSMDESGYFYDSPPIYHYGNNPLYFARFNFQSSSGELHSYSEASDNHAPQFASLIRSDSPGLTQFTSSVRSDSQALTVFRQLLVQSNHPVQIPVPKKVGTERTR